METRILLRLPEDLYEGIKNMVAVLKQDQDKNYTPGDVIRAMIAFALTSETKE